MGIRRSIALQAGAALLALALASSLACAAPGSIVPAPERISDSEASRELARLLSRSASGLPEAMEILDAQLRKAPQDADARLALAEVLARAGRVAEAEQALRALPPAFLDRPENQERVGDAWFAAGRMDRAAEHYGRALQGGRPALRKLAQALGWSGDASRARPLLEKLAAENPADREVALLLVRLRLADGDAQSARELAGRLLRSAPDNALALAELADVEAALGHAASARSLYARAVALPDGGELVPRQVQAGNAWGAFGRAVAFWRGRVEQGELSARLPLALAHVAAQRDAEAEGMLRIVMRAGMADPDARSARLALARLKLDEENPAAALEVVAPLLPGRAPQNLPPAQTREAVALAARAHWRQGDPKAGLALLAMLPSGAEPALRARLLLAAGRTAEARDVLDKARAATPRDPELSFLALGEGAASPSQVDALTAAGARTPAELTAWASLYSAKGWRDAAIRCLRAALAADKDYFPARMGLAETLAASRRYPEALAELEALAAEFPDSSKILLARARVLSWDRRYAEAQAAYAGLSQSDPADPVPLREAARVFFWAKQRPQALATYARLLDPAVDEALAAELATAADATRDGQLRDIAEDTARGAEQGSLYRRYEALSLAPAEGISGAAAAQVDSSLARNLPAYRIQKAAALESRAKSESFDNRFARALPLYRELLDFEPGNQEARFDQAQAACSLGLCSQERVAYNRLLEIDPLHTLAGTALERLDRRTAPALALRQNVWHEEGRGSLSRILRMRTDLGASAAVYDDHRLSLTQHLWEESPRHSRTYEAVGQTLAWEGVFGPRLRANAAWTNKRYTTGGVGNVDTGRARMEFNLDDAARVGIGYERAEELANEYALRQKSLSDALFADLRLSPARAWDIFAEARAKSYSDGNTGDMQRLSVGYLVTDHPRQLKAILSGERRNTGRESQEIYSGAALVDIRRPYWTPRDYTAGSLALEWRHDLAELEFCGAPQHWYGLRASGGTDSENNPFVRFEAEWRYEFAQRWSVEARGLVHRSPQWDADGLWLGLGLGF